MRDNNINTLRFLGAFLVLFGHAFVLCYGLGGGHDPVSDVIRGYTGYHAKLPGIGVAMFFVLSGYLVTRSFENRPRLLAYMEARILRIYPALWVTLLLTVFVLGPLVTNLSLAEYFDHAGTWRYLQVNARLFPDVHYRLPGVFMDNPQTGGVNGSLWTLPIEVRMYAIVAVLGLLGLLKQRSIFNLVALLMIGWYIVAPDHYFLLHKLNHERLGLYFLLGAFFYVNREVIRYNWMGMVVLLACMFISFGSGLYNLVYAIGFSYLVLYVSFHPTVRLPDLGRRGDFSYGLYLYAFPVTQVNIFIFGPESPWFIASLTFVVTLLLAIASWNFVEKPCLNYKGVLSGRWGAMLSARASRTTD